MVGWWEVISCHWSQISKDSEVPLTYCSIEMLIIENLFKEATPQISTVCFEFGFYFTWHIKTTMGFCRAEGVGRELGNPWSPLIALLSSPWLSTQMPHSKVSWYPSLPGYPMELYDSAKAFHILSTVWSNFSSPLNEHLRKVSVSNAGQWHSLWPGKLKTEWLQRVWRGDKIHAYPGWHDFFIVLGTESCCQFNLLQARSSCWIESNHPKLLHRG